MKEAGSVKPLAPAGGLLLALGTMISACDRPARPPETPPNVLLVVLDTLRADAVDPAPGSHTPVIAALAREGTLFMQGRSTASWTVPAHASIFTGLFPSRHNAHNEGRALSHEAQTLAELLSDTHDTAAFSENPHITRGKQFHQGFAVFKNSWPRHDPGNLRRQATDRMVQEWLTGRSQERPFFLFLNFMDPHLPYRPPPQFEKLLLGEGVSSAESDRLRSFEGADARRVIAGKVQLSEAELAVLRRLYRAEVASADARLGKVLETLRSQNLLDETLEVVLGDHGENIGDHGLMEHQFSLHETLLRVPILLRLPGSVPAGTRRHDPVQLVDVFPTVLEATDLPRERWPPHEGESLLGPEIDADRALVAEYRLPLDQERIFAREMADFDFSPLMQRLQSIQVGTKKLILAGGEPVELHDLAKDPAESENLLEQEPASVRLLLEELRRWQANRPTPLPTELGRREAETIEALRELGYVE